jgi:hypothetical protein
LKIFQNILEKNQDFLNFLYAFSTSNIQLPYIGWISFVTFNPVKPSVYGGIIPQITLISQVMMLLEA